MLKKLLIPCLFVAAAIAINSGGCGSSSGGGTAGKGGSAGAKAGSGGGAGSTGSAGATAGATGSAGATAGATGSAGATAGATGSAGATAGATGSAGATAGATGSAGATAGSTGSGGSTTDGGGTDAPLPQCTSTTATSTAMSASDFCKIYIATCGTSRTGYTSEAECETSYGAVTTQKMCRSYHLCNAVSTHDTATHCPHAVGIGQCN